MPSNLVNKCLDYLIVFLLIIVIAITLATLSACSDDTTHAAQATPPGFVKDSASSDTSVETLKTLTADISTVEEQNKQLVAQNNALTTQDKTTLEQFKKDLQAQVDKQLTDAKTQLQTAQTSTQAAINSSGASIAKAPTAAPTNSANANPGESNSGLVWVDDLQASQTNTATSTAASSSKQLAALLNPGLTEKQNNTNKSDAGLILPTLNPNQDHSKKPLVVPYYTIPVNATLTGAVAMQPIIGRVPIDGKVPDPYTFKVIIGPKDLAANGVDIPSNIQGIVASGVAEGDMLGQCARGDVTAMTFVFTDGRISTTQAKDGSSLGTIAGANGNPCLAGKFHTDAAIYLGAEAGLAGMQGYGNALSQAQLNNTTSPTSGSTISSLVGSANTYAFGQGFSASAQAAQKWWDERVQNSFDFVYVANVDPKTGKKLKLNINITQEIPIDYDPNGRKVFYDHQQNKFTASQLD